MPPKYTESYMDQGIKTATEGTLFTKGLTGCVAVLLYTEKGGAPFASMGHHLPPSSRNDLDQIVEMWAEHKRQRPELQEHDYGLLVVARDRHGSYGRRTAWQLVQGMQSQYPKVRVVVAKYEVLFLYPYQPVPASFSCDLDGMTWSTDIKSGRLKP